MEILAEREPMSLGELTAATGLKKPTLCLILKSLVELGCLEGSSTFPVSFRFPGCEITASVGTLKCPGGIGSCPLKRGPVFRALVRRGPCPPLAGHGAELSCGKKGWTGELSL